ncbi:MAG: hypothetical protein Fur0037_03760 [Planctomycetota bacterium]
MRSAGPDYETSSRRHSAALLATGETVTVLGVKQDDGTLAAEREVPLLITPKTREARVAGSQRSESWLFAAGILCAFAGGTAAALMVENSLFLAPGRPIGAGSWAVALLRGAAAALPVYAMAAWNRLVRQKQQVMAAFRQVDVDLSVRAALVPNLVMVVEAFARHERQLLEGISALRAGSTRDERVRGEAAGREAARSILLLHEHYPELKAYEAYLDLHDRL